jgi:hypothetical protein
LYSKEKFTMSLTGHLAVLAAIGMLAVAIPGLADTTFSTSYSDDKSNTAGGTAVFSASGGILTIKITNTTGTVNDQSDVITGLSFALTGGSGVSLSSTSATGFEDCSDSSSCQSVAVWDDDHNGSPPGATYLWGYSSPQLAAGGGSWKPGGIVNSSITEGGSIGNAQHNDYLMGPVTFSFTYTGTITNVGSVSFHWGTGSDTSAGTCTGGCGVDGIQSATPEPASIVLLSGVLFLTVGTIRRKFHKV